MDLALPYELDEQVALRPEPFGALAYHYGTRRLLFLKSPALVAVVRALGQAPSAAAALDGAGLAGRTRAAVEGALAGLATAGVIRAR